MLGNTLRVLRPRAISWGQAWYSGASSKPGFLMERQLRILQKLNQSPPPSSSLSEPLQRLLTNYPNQLNNNSGLNSRSNAPSIELPDLAELSTLDEAIIRHANQEMPSPRTLLRRMARIPTNPMLLLNGESLQKIAQSLLAEALQDLQGEDDIDDEASNVNLVDANHHDAAIPSNFLISLRDGHDSTTIADNNRQIECAGVLKKRRKKMRRQKHKKRLRKNRYKNRK